MSDETGSGRATHDRPAAFGDVAGNLDAATALVDWQIDDAVRNENLITEGYQKESARYATYEAHASDYVQYLCYSDEENMTDHRRRRIVDGQIWLAPGETAKVYTAEVFNLGENMYAMVTGLGQLYACGLSIGSTYVDPGSRGAIYLAVTNTAKRAISIPVGCPIARVQFWRLGERPRNQHPGHQSRRRIDLPVRDADALASGDRQSGIRAQLEKMNTRAERYEAALVIQACFFLGLFWYVEPAMFDRFFSFAAGDDLPPAAHFLVPVIMGPIAFLVARRGWRAVREPLRDSLRRAIGRIEEP